MINVDKPTIDDVFRSQNYKVILRDGSMHVVACGVVEGFVEKDLYSSSLTYAADLIIDEVGNVTKNRWGLKTSLT